ncbi:hypothetical protein MRB53_026457 [Persea americana]|uniref:Uncharacterized protein n=1 Tax=Persea americana TaxID=3435 RepID=A0ACC2LI72_PERAE|nr:hypothetical protein MRB53_026457 [Persea americana]
MVHVARIVAADHISSNPDAAAGDHPDVADTTMEFFMHDIMGGSSPTARPITGLLGSIYSSQVPFARPIGFTTPRGGVPIPNANGAIRTINGNNGIPLGTGLSGTTFSQPTNGGARCRVADDRESPRRLFGQLGGWDHANDGIHSRIEGGEYGDSLNFFGVYKIGRAMSHLSATGGTGKFKNAGGFAEVRPLFPSGQHVVNGAETLLRISVHLT